MVGASLTGVMLVAMVLVLAAIAVLAPLAAASSVTRDSAPAVPL